VAGQNGLIWIRGDNIADELLTKEAIQFVSDNALSKGLTEKIAKWLDEKTKGRPKREKKVEDVEEIENE
jgi:exosome complex RNA-binding protein Rrp4